MDGNSLEIKDVQIKENSKKNLPVDGVPKYISIFQKIGTPEKIKKNIILVLKKTRLQTNFSFPDSMMYHYYMKERGG